MEPESEPEPEPQPQPQQLEATELFSSVAALLTSASADGSIARRRRVRLESVTILDRRKVSKDRHDSRAAHINIYKICSV